MPHAALRSALLAALALALPGAAPAATIHYLAQERFVELLDLPSGTLQRVEATDFSDFDETLVSIDGVDTVAQTSSLRPTRIQAEVSQDAVSSGDDDQHEVTSSFSVTFELDEASPFLLQGRIEELYFVTDLHEAFPHIDAQVVVQASLTGPAGIVAVFDFDLQADCAFADDCSFTTPIEAFGVLDPGVYTLEARTFAKLPVGLICFGFICSNQILVGAPTDALASVDFQLVPEPGTAVAVAAGLLALAAGARRARPERGHPGGL